jgi:hypothetical protein
MRDAVIPVDLASLAAGAEGSGALWRLDGEDLQANMVRLGVGDRIQPHRNDLAPMALVHVPKGTVRAIVAVDGPLAYLSVHAADRRACRLVGKAHGGRPQGRSRRVIDSFTLG